MLKLPYRSFVSDFVEVQPIELNLVPQQVGEDVVMIPEPLGVNRYSELDAESMSLSRQIAAGVPLQQTPTFIKLEGVYGADRTTNYFNHLERQLHFEN